MDRRQFPVRQLIVWTVGENEFAANIEGDDAATISEPDSVSIASDETLESSVLSLIDW